MSDTLQHTNRAYANELRLLHDRTLLIAGRVEKMTADSITALSTLDTTLAKATIEYDKHIDRDELTIDRKCIEILARRQPLGEDLRLVVSVLKMVTYYERLGDLSVKICQAVLKLNELGTKYDLSQIEEMATQVQLLIKDTMDSFLNKDTKKAKQIIENDKLVDEMYQKAFHKYLREMTKSNEEIESQYHLMSIAKWLERMGDHCTNLAELLIFMVQGKDIRHPKAAKLFAY